VVNGLLVKKGVLYEGWGFYEIKGVFTVDFTAAFTYY
jgi:hypothetical protein